jgi:uncharacterized metal-binding protein YceD (DUF177 family)
VTEHLSNWTHNTTDIPAGGLDRERQATDAERAALAQELDLLKLEQLATRYRIKAVAGGGYRLVGRVTAAVEQACVVTLEPVASKIDAPFDVEFRAQVETADNDEDASVLAGPDVDIMERGVIPVGRIVFETLSGSLDPYPRRPDAAFDWHDPEQGESEKSSPFAALSKLKTKE